ncbi:MULTISPECIES: DUF2505 domain-containing protein [unclassified Nocardioides]|uniref:DUF2505 domain-containing protein n=1 Tax=unclassified Nocardioides TaxID=2615069 RepID=UPI00070125DB|nr:MULTISPECIES: DUF2505 domain-containing protein [unclassified Nocardioides]KRA38010.1 hypothetical protein ASD81_04840 [Nocardioides sp. Root614]KRA91970.1 hypothetical protein ASD84_05105 [Nocardioides sp. Root682]
MATRLLHTMVYDAPIDAVAAMLSDASFREEVCTYQRATGFNVKVDGDVNSKDVRIEMTQPTDRVPSFAKKIVGTEVTIVQTEKWSSPTRGEVHITIPGKPGDLRGTATLVEVDGVTTETVDLQVTAKIPLIGGKIEELIAKLIGSALRAEERTGKAWLSR